MRGLIGKMSGAKRSALPTFPISAKQIVVCILLVMVLVTSCYSFVWSCIRVVTIAESEAEPIAVRTFQKNVGGLLEAEGIFLNEGDEMNADPDTPLTDDMTIEIYRAIPVKITAMGDTKEYLTTARKVGDILNDVGIQTGEKDIITPNLAAVVSGGAEVTVVKVEEEIVTVDEEIPFQVKEKINSSMSSGETKRAQEGKPGLKQYSYLVSYHDGTETSRELVSEEIVTEPVDEIKEIGAAVSVGNFHLAAAGSLPSRGGNLSYSRVVQCTATAYDLSFSSCGKNPGDPGYGITASGMKAQYGVIAVDPRVIPLGSRLYIESPNGSWCYGYAVAGDTGGAIKGNRIDLFFDSHAEALRFGRRTANVYILN